MDFKKYLDYRLLGLIGSILMIISEFLPWVSGLSLLEIYNIYSTVGVSDAFLYIFPILCGGICIIASILMLYKEEYRINSVIIYFIGLAFMLYFLFGIIPDELDYLSNAGIGVYFCVAGFLFVMIDIINILMEKD